MAATLRQKLAAPGQFSITLELVPGPESIGRSVDAVKAIAEDARKDGRVAAVSITDNPGGNPSLSPDVLGREILESGMDVIVHVTCRDLNRAGLESRALQLYRMGLKNILALTGDYSGKGFGGQGLPVFDLDSVTLICLLHALSERAAPDESLEDEGGHGGFFVGCAASPFKWTEAECCAQYAKLRLKKAVCADFVVSQLGYDARKFQELIQAQRRMGIALPTLGTVFILTPGAARALHAGNVPGAVVTERLLERVSAQAGDKEAAREAAIESAARLAAVLKGLGYAGIHLGGVRRSFAMVERILNRMEEIDEHWQEFLPDFDLPEANGFYFFEKAERGVLSSDTPSPRASRTNAFAMTHFQAMRLAHHLFFRLDAPLAPLYGRLAALFDRTKAGRLLVRLVEDPAKAALFRCQRCGDCAIQHLAFLCPESQCPKHMRNGACGGERGRTLRSASRTGLRLRAGRIGGWPRAGKATRLTRNAFRRGCGS